MNTTSAGAGLTTPTQLQNVEPRMDNASSYGPFRLGSPTTSQMDVDPDGQGPPEIGARRSKTPSGDVSPTAHGSWPMYDLHQVISERRSTRMFLPHKPVPRELVDEALALAVRAPSNSNIQPWHMVFASG